MLDPRQGFSWYAAQGLYDLIAGRYSAFGMMNESKQGNQFDQPYTMKDFTPAALRNAGVR
ncbi:hypothetical protein D3C80_2058260 [compost metagenome]